MRCELYAAQVAIAGRFFEARTLLFFPFFLAMPVFSVRRSIAIVNFCIVLGDSCLIGGVLLNFVPVLCIFKVPVFVWQCL